MLTDRNHILHTGYRGNPFTHVKAPGFVECPVWLTETQETLKAESKGISS